MNLSRASNTPKAGFNLSQTLKKPECKETARYSNKVYFAGKYFVYIFEKLNYQCRVNIIFNKCFYINGKTESYIYKTFFCTNKTKINSQCSSLWFVKKKNNDNDKLHCFTKKFNFSKI